MYSCNVSAFQQRKPLPMKQQKQLFQATVGTIESYFDALMRSPTYSPNQLLQSPSNSSTPGVYVFSEIITGQEVFLYVGQAVSVFNRLNEHCGRLGGEKANFAYKLVMATGQIKICRGSPTGSKSDVFRDPKYPNLFAAATDRILRMNYRFIGVPGKLERNLLEIYTAVVLQSEHNNFD